MTEQQEKTYSFITGGFLRCVMCLSMSAVSRRVAGLIICNECFADTETRVKEEGLGSAAIEIVITEALNALEDQRTHSEQERDYLKGLC